MRTIRILVATVTAASTVVAAAAIGAAPASAHDRSTAHAAASAVARATIARGGPASAPAAGAPQQLGKGVTIGAGDSQVRVTAGAENSVDRVVVGGRAVYVDSETKTSTVVQEEGPATQVLKVIEGSAAPTSYTFRFDLAPGMRLVSGTDGVIIERGEQVVGYIDAPWAVDAAGAKVPTKYDVRGNLLVQTVAHEGAAYPVVADPRVSIGRYWYVRYNRSEVARVNASRVAAGNTAALTLMCGLLTAVSVVLGAVCGAIGGGYIASVMGQVRDAQNAGQCILHRYNLAPVVLVAWERYNC